MDSRIIFSTSLEAITSDEDFQHLDEYKKLLSDIAIPAPFMDEGLIHGMIARHHESLAQHRSSKFYSSIINKINQGIIISIYEFLYFVLAADNISKLDLRSLTALLDYLRDSEPGDYSGIGSIIEAIQLARKYAETTEDERGALTIELMHALKRDRAYFLNLQGAELAELSLNETVLYYTDFSRANLAKCQMLETSLTGCHFINAKLDESSLVITNACGVSFDQASITQAKVTLLNARHISICESNLRNSVLNFKRCDHLDLRGANLESASLYLPLHATHLSLLHVRLHNIAHCTMNLAHLTGSALIPTDVCMNEQLMQKSLWHAREFATSVLYLLTQADPDLTEGEFVLEQFGFFQSYLACSIVNLLNTDNYSSAEKLRILDAAIHHPVFCLLDGGDSKNLSLQVANYIDTVASSIFGLFGSSVTEVNTQTDLLGEFNHHSPMNEDALAVLKALWEELDTLVNGNSDVKLRYFT